MTDEDGNPVDPEEGLKELADVVIAWHASRIEHLDEILNSGDGKKGIKIHNEMDGSDIVIEGEKLAGFKVGLHVAKLVLGKLPFTLQGPGEDNDDEEELEPEESPVRPGNFGHFS